MVEYEIVSKKGFLCLAHSKNFVVLATDDEPVGVDIEKIDHTRPFEMIAKRKNFGVCKSAQDFYKKWTAYEADFKLSQQSPNPSHQFIEYHGFLICLSSSKEKAFQIIEKCPE